MTHRPPRSPHPALAARLTDAERAETLRRVRDLTAGSSPTGRLTGHLPPPFQPLRPLPPTRLDVRPAHRADRADRAAAQRAPDAATTSYVPVVGSLTASDYVDPADDPAGDEPRIRHDGVRTLVTLVALLVVLTTVVLLVLG